MVSPAIKSGSPRPREKKTISDALYHTLPVAAATDRMLNKIGVQKGQKDIEKGIPNMKAPVKLPVFSVRLLVPWS